MFEFFSNESLRKLVVGFGNLFNDVYVGKFDDSGELVEKNRVPITYSPKEKFIRRIQEPSTITEDVRVEITLPRLGFEMLGMNYDPTRKVNKLRQTYLLDDDGNEVIDENGMLSFNYSEVPYLVNFGLYAFTRTIEENLQIVEQVASVFSPEFVISMNFNEINNSVNVPIILTSTGMSELYEGSFLEKRLVTTSFSFIAKSYIYGRERTKPATLNPLITLDDE
tara:strand:- start:318 stop:986 length:669 start_codon:yes stop_codon:yes gene_type:complete